MGQSERRSVNLELSLGRAVGDSLRRVTAVGGIEDGEPRGNPDRVWLEFARSTVGVECASDGWSLREFLGPPVPVELGEYGSRQVYQVLRDDRRLGKVVEDVVLLESASKLIGFTLRFGPNERELTVVNWGDDLLVDVDVGALDDPTGTEVTRRTVVVK